MAATSRGGQQDEDERQGGQLTAKSAGLGVSVRFVEAFVEVLRAVYGREGAARLTTGRCCAEVVVPLTEGSKGPLASLLASPEGGEAVAALLRARGAADQTQQQRALAAVAELRRPRDVAPARLFVSHAWGCQVEDVLLTAIQNVKKTSQSPKNDGDQTEGRAVVDRSIAGESAGMTLWFDLFANAQHNCQEKPFLWWAEEFKRHVAAVGHTLVVLTPWDRPLALSRVWVLFEIFCTVSQGCALSVALPPAEEASLSRCLVADFDRVLQVLCAVDVQQSHASFPADRDMIFTLVQQQHGGFRLLNATVLDSLRQWLLSFVQTLRSQQLGSQQSLHVEDLLSLQYAAGRLSIILGRLQEALELLATTHEQQQKRLGERHLDTLRTAVFRAMALYRCQRPEEARALYAETLEALVATVGLEHAVSLSCLSGHAWVCELLGELGRAEELCRTALLLREKLLGSEHPDTLISMNNLGSVLGKLGHLDDCHATLSRCLHTRRATLGASHPDSLFSAFLLASVARRIPQHHLEARPLLEETLRGQVHILGEDHPDAIRSAAVLASWEDP